MSAKATLVAALCGCSFQSAVSEPTDAGVDVGPPGAYCRSNAAVRACVSKAPTEPRTFTGTTRVDTERSELCARDVTGESAGYCVIAASAISIPVGAKFSAHGARPLVLLASQRIDVLGELDVAGHRDGVPQIAGPGATVCAAGTPATVGGGGYGGSLGSQGGRGGDHSNKSKGGAPPALAIPTALRAGCAGEAGPDGGGTAGSPGGAVALLSAGSIRIDGAINASGGGGGGAMKFQHGGGGGGSGGMIVLDAPDITSGAGAVIFANGGGAGEGAGGFFGEHGSDAPSDPTMVAAGGSGITSAGDGGHGAIRDAKGGDAANDGGNGGGGDAAGGGGGGGVGVIRIFGAAAPTAVLSPPPT